MYHSLLIRAKTAFGTAAQPALRHTFSDYGLVPTTRPVISPPEARAYKVDVPGRNGSLDLTEALTGRVTYGNRTGSLEFLVASREPWHAVYDRLLAELHGRSLLVTLEDDPGFYYEGRLTVNEWKSGRNHSTVTLGYDLLPFKYASSDTLGGAAQAENGYLTQTADDLGKTPPLVIRPDDHSMIMECLVVCASADKSPGQNVHAAFDGQDLGRLKAGVNVLPTFYCDEHNAITITGDGPVTVGFRRGYL